MDRISLGQLSVPVIAKADICVLGGSCTGVFASVRAARLGAKVVLCEKQNAFGGVAASGLVTVWHTTKNMADDKQIIAGLSQEVLDRLKKQNALTEHPESRDLSFVMNTEELKIELDDLVFSEKNITPLLHTVYSFPYLDESGKLLGVVVSNKNGLCAILADYFIDATGDGDLLRDMPLLETRLASNPQPPSPGMKISGMDRMNEGDFIDLVIKHHGEAGLPKDRGWGTFVPGTDGLFFFAPTHIYGVNTADCFELTKAEIESRKHIRGIMALLRKYYPESSPVLAAVSSYIGCRESRHASCLHSLCEDDILSGKRFDDAVANGTYRCDIHSDTDTRLTFKYLDGRQVIMEGGKPDVISSWLKEGQNGVDYYTIPLGCVIPKGAKNVLCAGRMIDADVSAFGAVRVMINLNQLGEAAGVCAFDCLDSGKTVDKSDAAKIRSLLKKGGSIIL